MDRIVSILTDIRPEFDFANAAGFVANGMLDSLDMVTLVTALQNEYGVSIDGRDIVPENFNSLEAIAALVKKAGGTV